MCLVQDRKVLETLSGSVYYPKFYRLAEILDELGSVVVGLSGGVDSTLLAYLAKAVLGKENVLCVTAVSASLSSDELEVCKEFCFDYEINFQQVLTREMENPSYVENSSFRCYFCKSELFDELLPLAERFQSTVILGVNSDDDPGTRPGQRAALERGGRFPLSEAGIGKSEIRAIARDLGLSTWDKPQSACLASRIPFGTPVTVEALSQIQRVERALKRLGFRQLRARHHGDTVRLEVSTDDLKLVLESREEIVSRCKNAGYGFVTLDLEGFQSGSFHTRKSRSIIN